MLSILPGLMDVTIYRGDSFEQTLSFTDGSSPLALPTTGWEAAIRLQPRDEVPLTTFTIDAASAGSGLLTLSLTTAQTTALPERTVWDLELTEGSEVRTYLRGSLSVTQDVTR